MPDVRYLVTIPITGGGLEDAITNTWYHQVTDLLGPTLDAPASSVGQFYGAIWSLYPAAVNLQAAHFKCYNMADPTPRPPLREGDLAIPQIPSGTSGPSEVAIVLSFFSAYLAGRSKARSRGRIYLGPLKSSLMSGPRPGQNTVDLIAVAAADHLTRAASATWNWITYSETQVLKPQGSTTPGQTVVGGWVDDAWDTVRRRSIDPTGKTTWGALPSRALLEPEPS